MPLGLVFFLLGLRGVARASWEGVLGPHWEQGSMVAREACPCLR